MQTEKQIRTYFHGPERCVVGDLEMITILSDRSFHCDECVCNEKGKQWETSVCLCTIYIEQGCKSILGLH